MQIESYVLTDDVIYLHVGDKAGKTYDHAGMLNQAYHDGTVPHYIFKSDGTHELEIMKDNLTKVVEIRDKKVVVR